MATESVFRGVITFLDTIGVYDVILPFLLVFTIMYAILEKTKILGVDKVGEKEFTKRNLNSVVAFVIAFFVIASTKLVALINEAMANIVVLALVAICVLMLVGVFFGDKEFSFNKDDYSSYFLIAFAVLGVILIFLQAIPVDNGRQSALEWFYDYMDDNWDSDAVASLLLIGGVVLFMYFMTKPTKKLKVDDDGKAILDSAGKPIYENI